MCARAKGCVTLCTCTCYMIKLPVQFHKTPDFNFYLLAQGKTCLGRLLNASRHVFRAADTSFTQVDLILATPCYRSTNYAVQHINSFLIANGKLRWTIISQSQNYMSEIGIGMADADCVLLCLSCIQHPPMELELENSVLVGKLFLTNMGCIVWNEFIHNIMCNCVYKATPIK